MRQSIDGRLEPWEQVKARLPQEYLGILLGNGASIAVWQKFRYQTLYEIACDSARVEHLTSEDQEIFNRYGSGGNFEGVLSGLWTAKTIGEILGHRDTPRIVAHYERIKRILFQVIEDVHVPHALISDEIKETYCTELRTYDRIYSTNYGLILYWSTVAKGKAFKDFFWSNHHSFDIDNTDVWGGYSGDRLPTKVYYLHGAIHICADPITKRTWKKVGGEFSSILRQSDEPPLLVSDGSWEAKRAQIITNGYLNFCYDTLRSHRGALVVFGHSLTERFEQHIINAIKKSAQDEGSSERPIPPHRRRLAISMRPETSTLEIIERKSRLHRMFDKHDLFFFDSTTHPLGAESMGVYA